MIMLDALLPDWTVDLLPLAAPGSVLLTGRALHTLLVEGLFVVMKQLPLSISSFLLLLIVISYQFSEKLFNSSQMFTPLHRSFMAYNDICR